jgi:putative DNA primase/helicase
VIPSYVSAYFKVAKKAGVEWSVHCPYPEHDDQTPSASVNVEKSVFNCMKCGGATLRQVAERMGWPLPSPLRSNPTKMTEICRYDYKDVDGTLLYQIVRKIGADGKKTFSAYNPATRSWKLDGVKRVPYRLPEVLRAIQDGQHVFICEGEKDCDRLAEMGFVATTNTFGARSTKAWKDHASFFEKGTRVFIIPDADEPGVVHAREIERILRERGCSVRVLSLGYSIEAKHGKDVSDWLAEGHDENDLISLLTDETPNLEIDGDRYERDYGHAVRLVPHFKGQYRFAPHRKSWMQYNGRVWVEIGEERMHKLAADLLLAEYRIDCEKALQSVDGGAMKKANKMWFEAQTYRRIQGALMFLRGWDGILTAPELWDRQPWMLNVRNGTFDLRTRTLHDHDPEQLVTQIVDVDYSPDAEGPLWSAHLERFLPDPDIRREMQRNLGLSLCGAQIEEVFPIWYGTGGNGKTTTIKIIQKLLGNYAIKAVSDLLIASKFDRHPTEVADLCGARCVFSVETEREKKLAEAKVKELTGGDSIKARFLYGNYFQFEKTWTIMLITNHKPVISGSDAGIWRRVRLIPWTVRIAEKDKMSQEEVIELLSDELPAILNWMIAGFIDVLNDRNWIADQVRAATEEYKHEQDKLAGFLDEMTEKGGSTGSSDMYQAYCSYCEQVGDNYYKQRTFSKMMKERGFDIDRTRDGSVFRGIRLKGDKPEELF